MEANTTFLCVRMNEFRNVVWLYLEKEPAILPSGMATVSMKQNNGRIKKDSKKNSICAASWTVCSVNRLRGTKRSVCEGDKEFVHFIFGFLTIVMKMLLKALLLLVLLLVLDVEYDSLLTWDRWSRQRGLPPCFDRWQGKVGVWLFQ